MAEEYTDISVKKIRGNGFITLSRYDNEAKNLYVCDQESAVIKKIDTNNYVLSKTFEGHNGIIWDLTTSSNDIMVSVSGDLSYIVWEISSGDVILRKEVDGIPKIARFNNTGDKIAIYINSLGKNNEKKVIVLNNISKENLTNDKYEKIEIKTEEAITAMEWYDNNLLFGFQNGKMNLVNTDSSSEERVIRTTQLHDNTIKMFDKSNKFENMWLSASSDGTAKEFNIETFETINTYEHKYPVNVAKYNYNNRKIYLGGGQEAMDVAKTNNNDLTLKVYKRGGKMTNIINGHFGPIRDLNFTRVNNNFVTAGQDGIVIVHLIDNIQKSNEQQQFLPKNSPTKVASKRDELLNDIFGNNEKDDIMDEIKGDTIKMKNLSYKSPKEQLQKKYIPGMAKPQNIIEQENFEKNLRENDSKQKESKIHNDDLSVSSKKEIHAIKVFGLNSNTTETRIRDIFENFGRIGGGRGIKLIKTIKEIMKVNKKIQSYEDLLVIINYTHRDSAERAVSSMNKTAFDNVLINVEHCN